MTSYHHRYHVTTVQTHGSRVRGRRFGDDAPPSVRSKGLLAYSGRLSGQGDLPKVCSSLRWKVGKCATGTKI